MNLITMVPATARFIAQMRGMRRHIVANNVTEFAVFQNWCDENNERWAEALDSGCAIAIEKFIADWNGRADANRWKHAAQPDDNIWDNELKYEVTMTEKENHLPNLSSEERAHALELAIQARRRYAALKARVKSGELTFTDAMDEEDAKRILVTSLLQSVPGIGASKAVVIMRLYRIPKGRRVGGLGIRQREALVALERNGWKL